MKTRTLLLLSVGCGLAILVAGMVLMLQLSTRPATPNPLTVGETGRAGDLVVTVDAVSVIDGWMQVDLTWSGPDDDDAVAGFTLVAPDRVVQPGAPRGGDVCEESAVEPRHCFMMFDVAGLSGSVRQLVLARAGERVRWTLEE